MIRHQGEFKTELRERMRGGSGSVTIEHFWEPGTELKAKTRLCARLTLPPGASIGFHEHKAEEEVYVILRGEGAVEENGQALPVKAGDSVLTGNGAGHAIANTGAGPLEILAFIAQY
ncbi:MAG: cupin domain-containing protein [Lentisphaeria bacterium]|jgi:mannose-6-phosphate isomerase-like protein (cupin superfamily)